jgi:hypothetical protein
MGWPSIRRIVNGVEEKRCYRCKKWFSLDEENYALNRSKKDGFSDACKPCLWQQVDESRKNKRQPMNYVQVVDGHIQCRVCGVRKPVSEFYTAASRSGYRGNCKTCHNTQNKKIRGKK